MNKIINTLQGGGAGYYEEKKWRNLIEFEGWGENPHGEEPSKQNPKKGCRQIVVRYQIPVWGEWGQE